MRIETYTLVKANGQRTTEQTVTHNDGSVVKTSFRRVDLGWFGYLRFHLNGCVEYVRGRYVNSPAITLRSARLLVLLALTLTATNAVAQAYPRADLFKVGFPTEVYEAAKVAEKIAVGADAAHAKALAEMKKAEAEFRLAVEKEEDMEKFVLAHSRYMQAAMAVIKSSDGLGDANMAVSRLYFSLTEATDSLAREIIFLDWLKVAHAHETALRLSGRVDDALIKAGYAKMRSFIG